MALVTVAVPVYSDFPWYIHSLESCLKQTSADFELLICINRPGDRSIEQWLEKHPFKGRVRVIHSEKTLPMAENWNRCIEACNSEWLVILHEDDELLPECIARMSAAIEANPNATSIIGGAEIIDAQGSKIRNSLTDWVRALVQPKSNRSIELDHEEFLKRLCWANFIYAPAFCIRRSRIGSIRFSDRWKFMTDLDFYVSIFQTPEKSVSLAEPLARYRRHEAAATSQMTKTLFRFEEEIAFYGELSERLRKANRPGPAFIAKLCPFIRAHIVLRMLESLIRLDFKTCRELCTLSLKGVWMN